MLEFEWGNPSLIMLSGDDAAQECYHPSQILYMYNRAFNETLINSSGFNAPDHHHQPHFFQPQSSQTQSQSPVHTVYDPRTYGRSYPPPPAPLAAMLSLEPMGSTNSDPTGFMLVPKSAPVGGVDFSTSRIGLNLGGRTYFSTSEDYFVNRLYRRSMAVDSGSLNTPRCQADGCNAYLIHAKHYHRRHKVCEFHSKAATVIAAGLTQRFCQQCSRFHLLCEFDNRKRSCRKRLADHNRRRRKSHHTNQEHNNKSQAEITLASSAENLTRSPTDSGAHSSASVTVAISPPRNSLDYFRRRSLQSSTSPFSPSTSSIFFSNG